MTTVSVCIATYGDDRYRECGQIAAREVAEGQTRTPDEIIVHHDPDMTLSQTRNVAASTALSDWLCFLDSDDELHPAYLDAMRPFMDTCAVCGRLQHDHFRDGVYCTFERAPDKTFTLRRSILVPAVQWVREDGESAPAMIRPALGMDQINRVVIGAIVPRKVFMDVGRFREWPMYEDWDLWLRCTRQGCCDLVDVETATYRAWTHPSGRNSAADAQNAYDAIRRANGLL